MKLFPISAICILTSASMMTFASPASDSQNENHLNLQLRNVYFKQKHTDSTKNWSQDGQTFQLNFESIYLKSFIGFNASYYGVIPLHHSGNTKSDNILIDEKILAEGDKGYQKLGQAYAKIKFDKEAFHFDGKIGLMTAPGGLIQNSSSEATPTSYTGMHGNLNINNINFYATFLNSIRPRTLVGTHDFVNQDNKKINHIWQTGAKYDINNITAEAIYAQSNDYAEQYALTAGYTFNTNSDLSISIDGTYQQISLPGSLREKNIAPSNKASVRNLNSHFSFSNFKIGLSYFKFQVNAGSGLNIFSQNMVANQDGKSFGNLNNHTGLYSLDGEKVWQLSTEYNFSDWNIPGLSATVTYLHGKTHLLTNTSLKEEETNIVLKYSIDDGILKGMSLKILKAWGKRKTYKSTHPSPVTKPVKIRAYLNYTIAVF